MRRIARGVSACALTIAAVAVTSAVGATSASASPGVYFCYNTYTIKITNVAELPYVTPAAVTTDSTYCPPGTTAIGAPL